MKIERGAVFRRTGREKAPLHRKKNWCVQVLAAPIYRERQSVGRMRH